MSRSVDERIEGIVSLYARGILTDAEAGNTLCDLAVHPVLFDHLERMPESLVETLRGYGERLPGHPEDWSRAQSGSPRVDIGDVLFVTDEDRRVARERQKVRTYWGARRLREHFFPDEPLPEFDRIRSVGEVDDVIVMEGDVVAVGTFYYPHDYDPEGSRGRPLHLITPDGRRLGVAIRTRSPPEPDHIMPSIQKWGRTAVVVGDPSVRTPEDVPLGTTLWMDRSHLPPIPDEPPAWLQAEIEAGVHW